MPKFRKKPVVIEAWHWEGNSDYAPVWMAPYVPSMDGQTLVIQTLEGVMRADLGDWIIQGIKGECYPCKSDVFEATYEPVKD